MPFSQVHMSLILSQVWALSGARWLTKSHHPARLHAPLRKTNRSKQSPKQATQRQTAEPFPSSLSFSWCNLFPFFTSARLKMGVGCSLLKAGCQNSNVLRSHTSLSHAVTVRNETTHFGGLFFSPRNQFSVLFSCFKPNLS